MKLTHTRHIAAVTILRSIAVAGPVARLQSKTAVLLGGDVSVRWESKYAVVALTYGDGLEGNEGAGVELGFMFLTVPYKNP